MSLSLCVYNIIRTLKQSSGSDNPFKVLEFGSIACYCCNPSKSDFFRRLSTTKKLKKIYIFTQYYRNNENMENL